jgi:hypothetical protein
MKLWKPKTNTRRYHLKPQGNRSIQPPTNKGSHNYSCTQVLQKTSKSISKSVQNWTIHEDMRVFEILLSFDNVPCSPIFPEAKQFFIEGFGHLDEDYSFREQELPPT